MPEFTWRPTVGFPNPAQDLMTTRIDLNQVLIQHPAATFFVKAMSDAMTGSGIFPGDLLIVDRSLEPRNNRVILAVLEGDFVINRLYRDRHCLWLVADNPQHAPIPIHQESRFEVWGVITHVVHAL